MSDIKVIGAKQNNLKNIDVTIPKHQLTVFTGGLAPVSLL